MGRELRQHEVIGWVQPDDSADQAVWEEFLREIETLQRSPRFAHIFGNEATHQKGET